MAKRVLFVQGAGEGAYEMDARMVASLGKELGASYEITYPAMPNEDSPVYVAWAQQLAIEFATLGDGSIIVGHSLGGATLVKLLAEEKPKTKIAGLFLISLPFFGIGGWQSTAFATPRKIGVYIDASVPVRLYQGVKDEIVPLAHLELYARELPQAVVRQLEGRDHQLNEDLAPVARDIELLA